MAAQLRRLWPSSLTGQLMLTVALALLLAQTVSALLIYRAQTEMREAALIHTAAFRLLRAARVDVAMHPDMAGAQGWRRRFRIEQTSGSPLQPGEQRDTRAEADLRLILADQDVIAGPAAHRASRIERCRHEPAKEEVYGLLSRR